MEYSVVSEYFSRDERKSPVWKSSEEFLYCLDSNEDKAAEVAEYMAPLINFSIMLMILQICVRLIVKSFWMIR